MANDPEFGRRLRDAKRSWERVHDRTLTWDEVGGLVGKAMGRRPLAGAVVYRWFEDGREPKNFLKVLQALALVLGTTPAALAFGEGAPQDGEGARPGRVLTAEDWTALERQAATSAVARKKKAAATKKGPRHRKAG